jgi:hypothetical protein
VLERPLIPLDGSPSAEEALEAFAPILLRRGSRPILLGLVPDPAYPETVARRLAARGLPALARVGAGPPESALPAVADEEDASLLLFLGIDPDARAARRVTARTLHSVAWFPPEWIRARPAADRILAATSGDWARMQEGVGELARAFGARVLVAGPNPAELSAAAEDLMDLRIPVETRRLAAPSARAVFEICRERPPDLLVAGDALALDVLGRTRLPVAIARRP